jgi:Tol biopolymer transport system component
MAFATGTKLGSYEITAAIGAGGMGEVYQAHDTKLGRDVAIKGLPDAFAHDFERLSRFQREAKVLASLNHPNIAAIYGLEEDAGRRYLVMELVPGQTLAERVKREGPVPVEEALAIAKQIAEALEAAHEKSIVHRDLKPANVKVTPEGKVKVLDFGLAKAFAGDGANEDPSNSPTLSRAATMQGVILGTAAYMSPEQARGKSVDKRTDIWAFGCVLYELLTGKQAFHGDDISETLAAVIKDAPKLDKIPAQVRRLLKACLEKDRNKRLRDIGDAWRQLEEPTAAFAPLAVRRSWIWPVVAGLLLLLVLGAGGAYFLRPPSAPERLAKLTIPPPEGATFVNVALGAPVSVSPDGRTVAFVAVKSGQQQVWLRPIDSLEAHAIPGTDGGAYVFWSPDSRSLCFAVQGKLKRIEVAGGPAQALADTSSSPGSGATAAWNADSKILFSLSASSNLYLVPAAGGERSEATKLDARLGEISHLWPEFLPDGKHYLYHVRAAGSTEFQIYVGVLGSAERSLLLKGVTNVRYAPPWNGHPEYLLFVRDRTLMAQAFDAGSFKLSGDAAPIAQLIATSVNATVGDFSVSSNGVLAYRSSGPISSEQELVWYDREGKQIGSVTKRPDAIAAPRLSPDGKMAAFQQGRQGTGSSQEVWLVDLARAVTSRFTFDGGTFPIWSADGSQIVFSRAGDGLHLRHSNGTGGDTPIWKDKVPLIPTDWSADGKYLLITRVDPQTGLDLWLLPNPGGNPGGQKPIPLLQTGSNEGGGRFAPGPGAPRWLAYTSNESGNYEIYVMAMPGQPPGKWQISNGGGGFPEWRGDGRELYYLGPDQQTTMAVDIEEGVTFRAGTPHALFKNDRRSQPGAWDPSADGKRFLLAVREPEAAPSLINVILNWQTALPKK